MSTASLLHSDPRREGIGKAAWQLEDCLRDRLVKAYPSNYKARELHFEVAQADVGHTRALIVMLLLTILESPSWCDNVNNFFTFVSAEERCSIPGVPQSEILLSNVPYIPPGFCLVLEVWILFVIGRKLLLERVLQVRYFKPIAIEYHSLAVIRFALLMVLLNLLDICLFVTVRPKWRLAFLARTGFLVTLPPVRRLGHCVMSVIGEFISIAGFYLGTVVFFAWIFVTIFNNIEGDIFGEPVNKGLDTFSNSLNTMFIAGSTDDFWVCLLPSYTLYRHSGLLWLIFLVIVHVLLLNLVLDTLVAAYTKYSEEAEEDILEEKIQGLLQVFKTVSEVTRSRVLTRETFMDFCHEYSKSPSVRPVKPGTADIMFSTLDCDGSDDLEKDEFFSICGVIQYDFWAVKMNSPVETTLPSLWNHPWFCWFRERVHMGDFDTFMNYVLLVNLVLVVSETTYDLYGWSESVLMENCELVFSFVYVTEVGLTLCVYSWGHYVSSRSNQFDFATTWLLLISSILDEMAATGGVDVKRYMNILRLLRLLRVMKQLKRLEAVQFMIQTITKLIMASCDILILLGVTVFFFSCLSTQLWGGILYKSHPELKETEYYEQDLFALNFNDFLMSFAVWVISLLCEYVASFPDAVFRASTFPGSWILFLIFYVIGVSIIFELVKAFTIEVFVELNKHRHEPAKEFDALKDIEEVFTKRGQAFHYRVVGDLSLHEKIAVALEEMEHQLEEEDVNQQHHQDQQHGASAAGH
mmetsp:Transcript_19687/g.34923  ORF Transcript_19687/g.34923 Transcript_19687/m.34923 type:complete len:751 (+) Transcript_19687:102-2354(+)